MYRGGEGKGGSFSSLLSRKQDGSQGVRLKTTKNRGNYSKFGKETERGRKEYLTLRIYLHVRLSPKLKKQ